MQAFSILNSRKRAVVALAHSIIFLLIAGMQAAVSHAEPLTFRGSKSVGGLALPGIYLALLKASRCAKEKLYFGLCSASASFGLVRILMGDHVLHVNVLRVLFLACAVLVGVLILRTHSTPPPVRAEEA
jgi:hypothetical protein